MNATAYADRFASAVDQRASRIGIIGLGYVGLPLAVAFWQSGFRVAGFDVNDETVAELNAGRSHLRSVPSARVAEMVASGGFAATTENAAMRDMDVLLICVPTPLDRHRQPDLRFVEATARTVAAHARAGQLVVLESTTYPGATREVLCPILESNGRAVDEDLFVAYSPEREDPGNPRYTTSSTPKVVGADSPPARRMALTLYEAVVVHVVAVSDTATAEAVKITENVFRSVNIALVNELKQIYEAMGIDIWEVQAAAATKPFGFMRFDPGPGLGGHCIPIDPFYLAWRARAYGHNTRFIELAGEINSHMPARVVERCMTALNDWLGKPVHGARILILGVSYKKNVNDTRESPAFAIMDRLAAHGADLAFHDPHVPRIPELRDHPHLRRMPGASLTVAEIAAADLVVICTDHDDVDYHLIAANAPLIVDTRNAIRRAGADARRTVPA